MINKIYVNLHVTLNFEGRQAGHVTGSIKGTSSRQGKGSPERVFLATIRGNRAEGARNRTIPSIRNTKNWESGANLWVLTVGMLASSWIVALSLYRTASRCWL